MKEKKVGVYFTIKERKKGDNVLMCKINYNQKTTTFSCENSSITKKSEKDIVRIVKYLSEKRIGFSIVGSSEQIRRLLNPFLEEYQKFLYEIMQEELKDVLTYRMYMDFMSQSTPIPSHKDHVLLSGDNVNFHRRIAGEDFKRIINLYIELDQHGKSLSKGGFQSLFDLLSEYQSLHLASYVYLLQYLDEKEKVRISAIDFLESKELSEFAGYVNSKDITIITPSELEYEYGYPEKESIVKEFYDYINLKFL